MNRYKIIADPVAGRGAGQRARVVHFIPPFLRGMQATQGTSTAGQAARRPITAVGGSLPPQAAGEILCADGQHLELELLPRRIDAVCQAAGGQS